MRAPRMSLLIVSLTLLIASCSTDAPGTDENTAGSNSTVSDRDGTQGEGLPLDVTSAPLLSTNCALTGLEPAPVPHSGSWAPAPIQIDGLATVAHSVGTDLVLNTVGGPATFVAGVNIGPTIPGFQPGEVAVRREDFRRWFPMMAELGFRAVRIYSIQSPAFYEEFRSYNLANPDSPLYMIHGAWIPEEQFIASRDLFDPGLQETFLAEIDDVVDVVFGRAVLPDRPGHASGSFTADVSPWVYAWILGVELDPIATRQSDRLNAGRPGHDGQFFSSAANATPTEIWLAGALDHAATRLAERGVAAPIGFANWPTTDPLVHPNEPESTAEDLVPIDANHVVPSGWSAGTFASYHAYPYYPDFQRREPGIEGCEYRGEPDNYAGYLVKLRQHHASMPVMISEFGVPSAWAQAHSGPQGRDQGDHSEQEAMAINAELMTIIHDLGFSGGYVFEWADEWFKFTWNTITYELPRNRRQLWMNAWTNEAHFGIVAIEPGADMAVIVDGSLDEWESNGSQVILESRGAVRQVRALIDEGYLYLGLALNDSEGLAGIDGPLTIGFDVLEADGGGLPNTGGHSPASDYAVTVSHDTDGQIWVAGHADSYSARFGVQEGYFEVDPAALLPDSGAWSLHQLLTNRPATDPATSESLPYESFNAGQMRRGTSDPDAPEFDSRAAWEAVGGFVELRIPFMALGVSDPSQRQAFQLNTAGEIVAVPFDRVGIDIHLDGEGFETNGYSWEPWQAPSWHERVKAGVNVLATANRQSMGD